MDINIRCAINSLSYGIVAKNVLYALTELGHNISLFPIAQPQVEDVDDVKLLRKLIENQGNFNKTAPSLSIWHEFHLAETIGKNNTKAALSFFELDQLNPRQRHHIGSLDKFFVASEWAKKIVEANGIKVSTYIAPLGVNTKIFNPNYTVQKRIDKTVFFACSKIEVRKGHDVLVDIFNMAFTSNDNVELVMLTESPFVSPDKYKVWVDLYKNSKLGDKIRFMPRVRNQSELASVLCSMDCGVFMSRAEAWDLGVLESMACGKPVIVTNYSGHTEFCNSDNSFLVDIDELETAYDGIWFHGNGRWAKLGTRQIDQAVEHMRKVHKAKQEQGYIHNVAGIETASRFSWKNTAQKIVEGLS
jgi:hypothetical protein